MRKNKVKIVSILLIALSIILIGINAYAHSGRTDSSGGHKDNKNKSGLGSYHYHCGGHPAHLHTNGVCPYSSSMSSNKSSTSSSSLSTKETSTVPTTIVATDIRINENITSMKEGESQKLTATITPENVTDKNITWKSSDESIATISSNGEIIAKKAGTVEITATISNGKTNIIKINIKEEQKIENSAIVKTSTMNKNNITNNTTNNTTTITENEEDSNPLAGVIALGLLGGGTYWGYKKYKKS